MTQHITIEQAYDIAQLFIANKDTTVTKTVSQKYYTHYTFKLNDFQLDIDAPHGGPGYDWLDSFYFNNNGSIDLYHCGHSIMYHHTKHNVGRAINRSKYNPVRAITRIQEPKFFKILDLAEDRFQNRIIPINHTDKITQLIQNTLQQKQR